MESRMHTRTSLRGILDDSSQAQADAPGESSLFAPQLQLRLVLEFFTGGVFSFKNEYGLLFLGS